MYEVYFNEVSFQGNIKFELIGPAGTDLTGFTVEAYSNIGDASIDNSMVYALPDQAVLGSSECETLGFTTFSFTTVVTKIATSHNKLVSSALVPLPSRGLVLKDPGGNIIDAIAIGDIGDMVIDDPGPPLTISGPTTANEYVHVLPADDTDNYQINSIQAPQDGWNDDGSGWLIAGASWGAINEINCQDCLSTLSIELSAFTVTATMTGIELAWTTESETENLGFLVERRVVSTYTEATADKSGGMVNSWQEIASYKINDDLLGQGTVTYATDYSYTDELVEAGVTYEYRLSDVDYNGVVTYHATRTATVGQAPLAKVEEFTVLPAYPNPFNPSTTIRYAIPNVIVPSSAGKQSHTNIAIYDLTGKLIATLFNGEQSSGWHSITWNGTNTHGEQVPTGMYFSKITFGDEVKTAKLMLLK